MARFGCELARRSARVRPGFEGGTPTACGAQGNEDERRAADSRSTSRDHLRLRLTPGARHWHGSNYSGSPAPSRLVLVLAAPHAPAQVAIGEPSANTARPPARPASGEQEVRRDARGQDSLSLFRTGITSWCRCWLCPEVAAHSARAVNLVQRPHPYLIVPENASARANLVRPPRLGTCPHEPARNADFYTVAAQILPVLFLAAAVQAGVLWRFARPLLDELDEDGRATVERIASFALLVLVAVVTLGEAQALYRLTGKTFLFTGDQPIYLALWAAGSAIVLPFVLAQVRLATRRTSARATAAIAFASCRNAYGRLVRSSRIRCGHARLGAG